MNKYFKHSFCGFSNLIGQNKAESKVNTLKVYLIMLDQGRTEKVKGGRDYGGGANIDKNDIFL